MNFLVAELIDIMNFLVSYKEAKVIHVCLQEKRKVSLESIPFYGTLSSRLLQYKEIIYDGTLLWWM